MHRRAEIRTVPDIRCRAQGAGLSGSSFEKGGSGGDDGGIESRVTALETANLEARDRLARIETRLDSVATKADLHQAVTGIERSLHGLTWKVIGSCALLVAAAYFIAKHIG